MPKITKTFPRILVFDSGVGALSIIHHIQAKFPYLNLDFLSDDVYFPYGEKDENDLKQRVWQVIDHFQKREGFDLLVVACNTASTICLPLLREKLTQPVIGVVPAIKPAAQLSTTKVIGILATPATVTRPYTHELIKLHAQDCKVLLHGSTVLVQEAEDSIRRGIMNKERIYSEVQKLLAQDPEEKLDVIVLGCTHFPLLADDIKTALGQRPIKLLDSGAAIAQRVGTLLQLFTETSTEVGVFREFKTSQT